jgi:hypothetical protein
MSISRVRVCARALWCLVGGLALPQGARAQDPPPPVLDTVRARTAADTVRGVVFDSLASEPLAGALVVAMPSGATTTTDSAGYFELLSDTLSTRVTVYHEVLDRIGLGALVVERPADRRRVFTIATPSLLTVWPQLCDSRRPLGARSVIVTGTARAADGRTRLAGAKILVQWPKPEYATGGPDLRSEETFSDSLGNFLICGVEEFVDISFLALSQEMQSGVVTVTSDIRPIRRVDLVLGAADQRGIVRGLVRDNDGTPLANVQLALEGVVDPQVTGADGRFAFPDVPTGSRMLFVRAVGYQPVGQLVDVMTGDNPPLTIPFEKVVQIEGVTITERVNVSRERGEFEMRKRTGLGRTLDSTTIMKAPNLRAAIQMTQGINVEQGRRGTSEFVIRGRRGCPAYVYLDGTLATIDDVNVLPPRNLAAIEFFASTALAPSRYIPIGGNDCAVVLFWTKNGLRP